MRYGKHVIFQSISSLALVASLVSVVAGCSMGQVETVLKPIHNTAKYAEIASWPAGTRVRIDTRTDEVERTFLGTVMVADNNGVALCNCEAHACRIRTVVPGLDPLFEGDFYPVTWHPVVWISMQDVFGAQILEAASGEIDFRNLTIDTSNRSHEEKLEDLPTAR